jgi:hypothetical protein
MALLAQSPRLQKLLVSAGTAGMVVAAVFGGYRYVAASPAPPAPVAVEAAVQPPPTPVDRAVRCAGAEAIPGAAGPVCKRPVAGAPILARP